MRVDFESRPSLVVEKNPLKNHGLKQTFLTKINMSSALVKIDHGIGAVSASQLANETHLMATGNHVMQTISHKHEN